MKIVRQAAITDANFVSSTVPETDYAEWDAGTTFAVGDYTMVAAQHSIYRSIVAGNINHNPVTDVALAVPLYWQRIGATARWCPFDSVVGSQATRIGSVDYVLLLTERIDTIAFLNIAGETINVKMYDATDGYVYDQTQSLVSDSAISDWYAYFFEPIVRKTEALFVNLPPYASVLLTVTLVDVGDVAAMGEMVMGLSREIGGTQYGARLGIRDYSIKEQDEFGNYTVLERAFSNRGSFSIWAETATITELRNMLTGLRATPALYIGADSIGATILFGFYKSFEIDISYPDVSICSLEVESLT